MTAETVSRTIMLILAPVVMFSACSIFVGGVLSHYTSIERQLPDLLGRHKLVHHAPLAEYAAIGIFIVSMCVIVLTAAVSADWVAVLVFGVFLAGVLVVLLWVVLITLEVRSSRRALQYEVGRVARLAPVTGARAGRTGPA